MMLESMLHPHNSFVTLTYSPENLPEGGTLVPKDTELFLKRLRFNLAPVKLRYFLCGEYGEQTWRPHYHAILFNVPQQASKDIDAAWQKGMIHVGEATQESMQYCAGYVTKKLTTERDMDFAGRPELVPEFARMSRRPGLGANALPFVAAAYSDAVAARDVAIRGDVPDALRIGGKKLPLGRYLKTKLGEELGYSQEALSEKRLSAYAEKMLPLLSTQALRDIFAQEREQAAQNALVRQRITSSRRIL